MLTLKNIELIAETNNRMNNMLQIFLTNCQILNNRLPVRGKEENLCHQTELHQISSIVINYIIAW